MRRYASFLLIVAVAACGSLQSAAVTPQQRLFAAYGDYVVYGQIVEMTVADPLTLLETKNALKELDSRVFMALGVARAAYERGALTEFTLVIAETALRELRVRLATEGKVGQ